MHRRDLLRALLNLSILALLPRPAAAAWLRARANVERSLLRGDIDIAAFIDVPVDSAAAWEVLTDYNRLAQFVPDMQVSRVVSKPGDPTRIYQRGEKSWLLVGIPLELVFQMEETPTSRIRFRLVSGNLDDMSGEWQIAPRGNSVRITYRAHMQPGLLSPRAPGDFLLIESDIEDMLKAIGQEMLRRKTVTSRP